MKNKINVKAVLAKTPVGETAKYRLIVEGTRKVDETQFVALLSEKAKAEDVVARFWLDAFRGTLFDLLAKNAAVDLNFLFAKLYVGGTVASMGDQPNTTENPVRGRIYFKGPFAERLAQIELENDTVTVAALLYELQQDGVDEQNRIESTSARIVVNGSAIKIDPEREDEGVWLEEPESGIKLAEAVIIKSDSSTCHCKFTTLPPTGKYKIVIATRDGKDPETYALAKATRNVRVIQEEE